MAIDRKRALIIGAPLGELRGVDADVQAMRRTLGEWGFELIERVGPEATRDGILCAIRELIACTGAGDAVAIYFAGHGGRCRVVERGREPNDVPVAFLVPVDVGTPQDFHGIAEFELGELVDELALRTSNVTVILDCCHSATLVRTIDVVRAWPVEVDMPDEWARALVELGRRPKPLDPEGHPRVVRVVAAEAGSAAYERHDGSGGYLTTELCAALAEARELPLPWDAILAQVRERMCDRAASLQRPEVEGPRWRLPFSEHGPAYDGERNVFVLDPSATPWLRSGRLHGLSEGDPVLIRGPGPSTTAGRIVELFDDSARLELDAVAGAGVPRAGDMAVLQQPQLRRTVSVGAGAADVDGLLAGLDGSTRLSVVTGAADHEVSRRDDRLEVSLAGGLVRVPQPVTPEGVRAIVTELDRVARTELLTAALASPPGLGGRNPLRWTAEVFVAVPGHDPRPLAPGETLREGTRIYVELRHLSDGLPTLYVNVLERGVAGRLCLLNQSEPAGVQLRPLEARWVGRRRHGGPPGMRLVWPVSVPRGGTGEESLIFVASQRPLDLRSLLEGPLRDEDEERASLHGDAATAQPLGTPLPWAMASVGFKLACE